MSEREREKGIQLRQPLYKDVSAREKRSEGTHDSTVAKFVGIVFYHEGDCGCHSQREQSTTTTFLDILLIEVFGFMLNDGQFLPK